MEKNKILISMTEIVPIIRKSVDNGETVEMTVTGNSMMPLLKNRISSVKLQKPDNIKIGDIVLFQKEPNHYVLHRIIRIHDGLYDILGDNQYQPDVNITSDAIIAKVCAYNRTGNRWKYDDFLYRAFLPAVKFIRRCGFAVKRRLFPSK